MYAMLLAVADVNALWYLPPLAAVISLVYSASRFELSEDIVHRALRLFIQILVFMAIVFAILTALSFGL